ncbi:MAG: AEC family transporter [Candidatus Cloacimonetes bacterium]|nr:AEC family transporter [Candidatus Cloacimonadota bacterium]
MKEFLEKIIPIILIFFLGYFLKRIRLFKKETGDLLLKLVFYVTLPALIFLSISNVELIFEFIYLPFIAVAVIFIVYFIALFIGKRFKLPPATLGTFLIGSMIMNTGFVLPFIIAAFGREGLALYTFFDLGNALLVLTFVYYIAVKYGGSKSSKVQFRKFLLLPPIWGLFLGIIFNLGKIELPQIAGNFLQHLGTPTIPLIMLSLGIYFSPKMKNIGKIITVLFIRMGFGLLLGFFFVSILNLQGLLRTIVIICSAAPVGYNTLVFSSMENLDKEFAASLVSISLLIGIFYIPILIFLL